MYSILRFSFAKLGDRVVSLRKLFFTLNHSIPFLQISYYIVSLLTPYTLLLLLGLPTKTIYHTWVSDSDR